MTAKKKYRKFIRINGKLVPSPEFSRKIDAEKWRDEMRRRKQLLRDGILLVEDSNGLRFIDFARDWIKKRMTTNPISTWQPDEQRLRDYILPIMADWPISSISTSMVRNFLIKISEEGFKDDGFAISTSTRDKVKALLSAMFTEALNSDPPLIASNPVHGIRFKDKRKGTKKPRYLENKDVCIQFLEDAKEIGWVQFVVSCIFLMSGVRKQELIALRWKCFVPNENTLYIKEKYIQANHSIVPGTKRGENYERTVPISKHLIAVLKEHKSRSNFTGPDDYIIVKATGEHYKARQISYMIEAIREKTGVDISAHGLRHTFGREFAVNDGNLKALQAILGHSSSSTTDIYSDLAGSRIKPFSEVVKFEIGVKKKND